MMGVEEQLKEMKSDERSCILVGVQIDANGRELLDWALSKIAKKGDRVVAVHVCRDSDLSNTTTLSLIKEIDDYLAVYEGLCSLKQVVLVGRISRGNSIRRVLVREAKLNTAKAVVVGANKTCKFGGSASVAKYCAKKLPPTTTLIALQNGKIILEKGSAKLPPGQEPKTNLRSILHPSVGMDPKVIIPSSKKKSVVDDCCVLDREPQLMPGWPLLRKTVSANVETVKDNRVRKMSVVQWVMNLPDRSLPAIQSPEDAEIVRNHSIDLKKELEIVLGMNPCSSCKWFTYDELRISTDYFSSDNLIGKGGNSRVYKGCLSNDQLVAIKVSKLSAESSKNFLLEVNIITSLQHDNIVPLIGICIDETRLLSVYSYFSEGSLEENLHSQKAKHPLSWDMRYKIAIGAAEALSFIHSDCSRPAIHRDVKSSNILLSNEFEPQLSDFGLALWAPKNSSYLTHNDVVGTFGYLAPEYFMYGKVSDKIDVYAFGVVLLELLTGRKPINDENPKGQESLVMWAKPILEKGEMTQLLDPKLEGKFDEDQVQRMVLAASLSINRTARLRPALNQILRLLRGDQEVEEWMNAQFKNNGNDLDCQDEETYPVSSFGSHLGLALLDIDDDASVTSYEQHNISSWEDYLKGRWSRSSSFE
ncbi:Non-specific serine/threonine protein kinase protein [Dioscorea alata]|uniref:Non-specific serine/threonine protein kinase protein n=2 Tax=Dioscorea alata TaxID=55571 RepID=A0ACB7URA5_DIOAL|nr:Non-specific serine/threonine protein kinase protein [Dioscorea alata]KAH7663227.1 Non-specific serine/threonine protein kinase protein [Dioscorea alata]